MPPQDEPTSPLEAYRQIIDELATKTSKGVSERLVRESGIFSKASGSKAANDFVASLTAEQRQILADMLRGERTGAIHDALVALEWWTDCRDVQITYKGEPMPLSHYDGLHMDYTGRQMGYPWPGDGQSGPRQANPKLAQELKRIAAADAEITDKTWPHCGQPCPSYRKSCKHCGKDVRAM